MIQGPLGFYTVASRLLTAISALEISTDLERVCIVPGAIAWDECECGMLAVSIGRMWHSENFPEETLATSCQGGILVAEITLQLMRCAPSPQGTDVAPACADLDTSAQQVEVDAWHLYQTTACTLQGLEDVYEIVAYRMRPLLKAGPGGGCVGSELVATVGLARGAA